MGVVKNITYDSFPKQRDDVGSIVMTILNEKPIPASVIRSDAESPNRKIYMTSDGKYLYGSEIGNFVLPEQGPYVGKKARVCFHYDASRTLEGTIVRDDHEKPYTTLIHLDDGRIVNARECQYAPKPDSEESQVPRRVNREVESLNSYLKKLKFSDRVRVLHGIYKQLIPSRKEKIAKGYYNQLLTNTPRGVVASDPEFAAEQIIKRIELAELILYIVDKMQKYNHLTNHAKRLQETDLGQKTFKIPIVRTNDLTLN